MVIPLAHVDLTSGKFYTINATCCVCLFSSIARGVSVTNNVFPNHAMSNLM